MAASGSATSSASAAGRSAKDRHGAAAPLALRLPSFFFAVWLMYWSLPLGALAGCIPVWRLSGRRRNDTFHWCRFLVRVLGIRFRRRGEGRLYDGPGPVLFLANHRSWADFFVDAYLAGGRAQMLSRLAVMYAFPMFMLPVVMMRGCIVFNRGKVRDKDAFNAWIDSRVRRSPQAGLFVFPEGHRSTRAESLPLKRGMLRYAYDRRMPVQIVMSSNKEAVLSEKSARVSFGATVVTSYSPVLQPSDHETFDSFVAAVQSAWDGEWAATMSADPTGLPALKVRADIDDAVVYPWQVVASQLGWAVFGAVAMFVTALWTLRAAAAATAWMGAGAQRALLVAAVAWFAASLVACYHSGTPAGAAAAATGASAGGKSAAATSGNGAAAAAAAVEASSASGAGAAAGAAGAAPEPELTKPKSL